jgi:hypothetical protein
MNESLHKRRQLSLALAASDGASGASGDGDGGSEDDADEIIVMSDEMWNALLERI